MKTIKATLVLAALCLTFNFTQAQNQLYAVHLDNVKPSMIGEYEKICKEFNEACEKYNPETSWLTASTSDFKFMYITPMENFAELDKSPFKDMATEMGDAFGELFQRFNKCYDSHSDFVIALLKDLSYMPDGMSQTQEGQNYRDFFYIYFTPENGAKIKEGMKAVKEMFANKGSKSHYRVYRSGFGNLENYYLVAISSKDEIDSAQRSKANDDLLGPERFETFRKVMKHASRIEEYTGAIRPDLSYAHKKN